MHHAKKEARGKRFTSMMLKGSDSRTTRTRRLINLDQEQGSRQEEGRHQLVGSPYRTSIGEGNTIGRGGIVVLSLKKRITVQED